jgi:hypothetical protein
MVAVCGPLTKCDNFWQSQGTPIPALQQRAANSHSMASPRDKLKTYCSLYDLERVEIIEDAGQSAKSLDRPGLHPLQPLLHDVRSPLQSIPQVSNSTWLFSFAFLIGIETVPCEHHTDFGCIVFEADICRT